MSRRVSGAQATNTPLTLADQLVVLGVLMITSKGSAGVTGSGFITLAATLASLLARGPRRPRRRGPLIRRWTDEREREGAAYRQWPFTQYQP